MVVALSRFKVANGSGDDVRQAFRDRPRLVENASGFLGIEAFTDAGDASLFYLITRWTDADSFRQWHSGPDHKLAHRGIPKGLKLDASFTLIRTLDPIPGSDALCRSDGARDSASSIAEFLHRTAGVYWLKVRSDGLILGCNEAIGKRIGRESLQGDLIWPLLTEPDAAALRHTLDGARSELSNPYRFNFIDCHRMPFTLECHIDVQPAWFELIGEPIQEDEMGLQRQLMTLNNQLAVLLRENDRKTKALQQSKAQLEQALIDLVQTQRHLANLQEVIPICMKCGKVKTGESRWEEVAAYFRRNNLSLSHGYCPSCGALELDKLDR
jgi:heme oxygenase (mycobilin-producing)